MTESCAECLYKRQLRKTDNEECLAEIRAVIDNRTDDDPAPYLVYQFNQIYLKYFGSVASFRDEKKQYNDLANLFGITLGSETVIPGEGELPEGFDPSQLPG